MTHDYKRHDTTILFAALSMLDGIVSADVCSATATWNSSASTTPSSARSGPRSRSTVLDNYATDKHPRVLAWLSRDPRWTFHFIPTSASWLNAVENFFILDHSPTHSSQRLPFDCRLPGRHQCLSAEHNANFRRFVWTKSADAIRAKLGRLPVSSESA